jgi:hypothetical protein
VLAAAHELPKPVQLRDALAILLVLLNREPERYPAAAARFAARLVTERRLSLTEAQLTYAAVRGTGHPPSHSRAAKRSRPHSSSTTSSTPPAASPSG